MQVMVQNRGSSSCRKYVYITYYLPLVMSEKSSALQTAGGCLTGKHLDFIFVLVKTVSVFLDRPLLPL